MATSPNDKRKHIVPARKPTTKAFTAHTPDGFTKQQVPELAREQQAAILLRQLSTLGVTSKRARDVQESLQLEAGRGIQIQFVGRTDVALSFEQLSNDTQHIELLSVIHGPYGTIANVFVPDGKLVQFEKYVTAYLEKKTDKNGKPLDHRVLIDTIASIRAAEIRGLWNDDLALLPTDTTERFWWEVWLPVRGKKKRAS